MVVVDLIEDMAINGVECRKKIQVADLAFGIKAEWLFTMKSLLGLLKQFLQGLLL